MHIRAYTHCLYTHANAHIQTHPNLLQTFVITDDYISFNIVDNCLQFVVIICACTHCLYTTAKDTSIVTTETSSAATSAATDSSTPVHLMDPRLICQVDTLLEKHIQYWTEHMPDVTDCPSLNEDDLQIWTKQKKKSRLKPHSILKGVAGKWLNSGYDYAISKNKWGVVFKDMDGVRINLVDEFVVTVWAMYCSFMVMYIYVHARTYMHATYMCFHARIRYTHVYTARSPFVDIKEGNESVNVLHY